MGRALRVDDGRLCVETVLLGTGFYGSTRLLCLLACLLACWRSSCMHARMYVYTPTKILNQSHLHKTLPVSSTLRTDSKPRLFFFARGLVDT